MTVAVGLLTVSVPSGAAADPVLHALLQLLDDVLRYETAAVIEGRLPRQHHRVVVDGVNVEEARRIGNICPTTINTSQT